MSDKDLATLISEIDRAKSAGILDECEWILEQQHLIKNLKQFYCTSGPPLNGKDQANSSQISTEQQKAQGTGRR